MEDVRDKLENPAKPDEGAGSVLRVRDLACRYARLDVFREVSFELKEGCVAFLTGPNGAGKSTLLRCLAGWDAPREGDIELCGQPFSATSRAQRRLIAFVPDVPAFYDDLTAAEHLRFVAQANRLSESDTQAQELMERFGLATHADQLPSSYSRGMRHKLALVLALIIRPCLLLLDEPYGPLDPSASVVLSDLLSEARDAGCAILASCHHVVPALEPDVRLHLEEGCLKNANAAR